MLQQLFSVLGLSLLGTFATNYSAEFASTDDPPREALEQTLSLSDSIGRGCQITGKGEQTYFAKSQVGGRDEASNLTVYSVPLAGEDRGTNKFDLGIAVCGDAWRVTWVPTSTDERFKLNGTAEVSAFSLGSDVAIRLDVDAKQVIRRVVRSPSDFGGMAIEPPSFLLRDQFNRNAATAWRWHNAVFYSVADAPPSLHADEMVTEWVSRGVGDQSRWVWVERVKPKGVTVLGKPLNLFREIHFSTQEPILPVRFVHYSSPEGEAKPKTIYGDWALTWVRAEHHSSYAMNGHVISEIRNAATTLDKDGATIDLSGTRYTDLRFASMPCDPANTSALPIEAPPEWKVVDLDASGIPIGLASHDVQGHAGNNWSLWFLSVSLAGATVVGLLLLRGTGGR